jgi:hypothetical protein
LGKSSVRSEVSWGLRIFALRWPVTAAFSIAAVISTVALMLVLANQKRLHRTDQQLTRAIQLIQSSRRESIRVLCQSQQEQNTVVLAVVKRRLQVLPAKNNTDILKLVDKLNPRVTSRQCRRLLQEAQAPPPPPTTGG